MLNSHFHSLESASDTIEGKMERENLPPGTICYCFGYSAEDIRKDFSKNGRSTIMERIQNEKKDGTCECAEKNPKKR